MLPEADILKEFRLRRYRIIWTKKWKRCGPQWYVSYNHGAIKSCYTMLLREREFKISGQAQVTHVAILRSSRNIMDTGHDLRNWTWPRKRGRPMDFCCRSAAQIKSGPSFKAPIGSAKLPRHILSNGQDELRILVEKAKYEAKACFFLIWQNLHWNPGIFPEFGDSLGLIFQEMTRWKWLEKNLQETRRFTFRMVLKWLKWLNPAATLVAYVLFVVSEATWVGVRKFVPWRPSKRKPWLMPWQAPYAGSMQFLSVFSFSFRFWRWRIDLHRHYHLTFDEHESVTCREV